MALVSTSNFFLEASIEISILRNANSTAIFLEMSRNLSREGPK